MLFGVLVVVYHAAEAGGPGTRRHMQDTPLSLLLKNLLDLTDLCLKLAG
jgi:hypothetical protein